jgi:hypothetical protein
MFAGGAIIAGLPFGAAGNVRDALDAMRSAPLKAPREWGDLVRAASPHKGPWPRISIWHGDLDATVNLNNAQAAVAQWADLHGVKLADAVQETSGGVTRLAWGDRLEVVTIAGMAHGAPIDSRDMGVPAPFILETGISSTRRIAQFWGLIDAAPAQPKPSIWSLGIENQGINSQIAELASRLDSGDPDTDAETIAGAVQGQEPTVGWRHRRTISVERGRRASGPASARARPGS